MASAFENEDFASELNQLSSAATQLMPNTDTAAAIDELCKRLADAYQEVSAEKSIDRKPILIVVSPSKQDRQWIVGALRQRIGITDDVGNKSAKKTIDGFGAVRPKSVTGTMHFELIDPAVWAESEPWSCVGLDPALGQSVDADLVVYAVKFEDLQNDASARGLKPFAGIPTIPIVIGTTLGMSDVISFEQRLHNVTGKQGLLPTLVLPDFSDRRTTTPVEEGEAEIWERCNGFVSMTDQHRQIVREQRKKAIVEQLRNDVRQILRQSKFYQVYAAIEDLRKAECDILKHRTQQWISGSDDLRVPIRLRIRLMACETTPSLCFPFRSLLGFLALTTGVWDRVVMGVIGSPVAMVLAAYQSGGNFWKSRNSIQELKFDAGEQFGRLVIGDLAKPFEDARREIARRFPGSNALADSDRGNVSVHGADHLLQEVRELLAEKCRFMVPRRLVSTVAIISTLVFAAIFSGPIIALYSDFFVPLIHIWIGISDGIQSFPLPEIGRIFTGFILGAVPGILAGMCLLTYLTRHRIIESLTIDLRKSIHDLIDRMVREKTLRLEGVDDDFTQIRFLHHYLAPTPTSDR